MRRADVGFARIRRFERRHVIDRTARKQGTLAHTAAHISMEVDYGPLDECKEGGDGALLRAGEHGDGDSADFSLQPPHGQTQISG